MGRRALARDTMGHRVARTRTLLLRLTGIQHNIIVVLVILALDPSTCLPAFILWRGRLLRRASRAIATAGVY